MLDSSVNTPTDTRRCTQLCRPTRALDKVFFNVRNFMVSL